MGGFQLRLTNVPVGTTVVNGSYDADSASWIVGHPPLLDASQSMNVTVQYNASAHPGVPAASVIAAPAPPPAADVYFATAAATPTVEAETNKAVLKLVAVPGRTYQWEYSTDLKVWAPASNPIRARHTLIQWTDSAGPPANTGAHYYRVKDITP